MKITIVKNKYINAVLLLMLFSAIVHMAILFFVALATGDFYAINYFHILDITYFFGNWFNGPMGNSISVIVVLAVYGIILKLNDHYEA